MNGRLVLLCIMIFIFFACTEKKKNKNDQPIPVESDGGIGDGTPPLDSLMLERQAAPLDSVPGSKTIHDSIQ